MIKVEELNSLVEILSKAGMDRDNADDLVIKAVRIAQDKKIPVLKALRKLSNPGGHVDFIERQLSMALREASIRELDKLTSLNTTPE